MLKCKEGIKLGSLLQRQSPELGGRSLGLALALPLACCEIVGKPLSSQGLGLSAHKMMELNPRIPSVGSQEERR